MTERSELLIKLALCLLCFAALLWRQRHRGDQQHAGAMLSALAVVALLAFTNFLTFNYGRFAHALEMFHYQLGSKYFPELGYDGLYGASVVAQVESRPNVPAPRRIRDLKTNAIVPASGAIARRAEVVARFSPARWKSFVADYAYFSWVVEQWPDVLIDHGYNPSPAWTFVGRVFNSWLPLNASTVSLLALLDWVLIGASLVVVGRTYGGAVAATFAILLGLGYPWRYVWVGGAFLRYDWFAAVVIGVCMLKRGRFGVAGALFAYATAVRIFPALLLVGVGVVAARDVLRRRETRWVVRFGGTFVGCLAACFIAGALAGRGFGAWGEFARDIKKHHATWSVNTVGLELLFLHGPGVHWPPYQQAVTFEPTADGGYVATVPGLPGQHLKGETFEKARAMAEEAIRAQGEEWQAEMNRLQAERLPFYVVAAALVLAALMLAAWQRPVDEAATLGVAAVFALLCLSCYYWVVLTLMALRRGAVGPLGLLALNVATLVAALVTPAPEVAYGTFSWGMVLLLVAWLGPDVLATLGRKPAIALAPVKATTGIIPAARPVRRRKRR
jgi:predicted RNase H-like HicB family nuclease